MFLILFRPSSGHIGGLKVVPPLLDESSQNLDSSALSSTAVLIKNQHAQNPPSRSILLAQISRFSGEVEWLVEFQQDRRMQNPQNPMLF
jgi:hypothetical protein